MEGDKLAFWGLELKPGDATPLELRDGEVLHVSMVSLGAKLVDKAGRSVITVRVGDDPVQYALCVLVAGKTESFNLDLTFQGEETIVLEVTGKNPVSLVGNFGYEDDEDDSDEDDDEAHLISMYDDDGMVDEDDESDEEEADDTAPKLIKDADPPVITELPDDPKPNVPALASKKGKGTGQPAAPVKNVKAGGTPAKKTTNAKKGGPNSQGKDAEEVEEQDDDDGDDDDDDEVDDDGDEDLDDEDGADVDNATHAAVAGQKPGPGSQKRGAPGHAGHTPAAKKAKTGRPGTPANSKAPGGSGPPANKDDAVPKTPKQANGATPKPILKQNNDARQGAGQKSGAGPSSGARASGSTTPAHKEQARDTPAGSGGSGKKKRRRRSKGGGESSA